MKIFAETPRLILRELLLEDADGMFEMDADPAVHRYLERKPVQSKQEVIEDILFVQKQYETFGMGRWAVILKETNEFIGWAGLKFIDEPINGYSDYYDLGYRYQQKHWGKGYATEAAIASRDYAFEVLGQKVLYAITDIDHLASIHVLEKTGFEWHSHFIFLGDKCNWLILDKERWEAHKVG